MWQEVKKKFSKFQNRTALEGDKTDPYQKLLLPEPISKICLFRNNSVAFLGLKIDFQKQAPKYIFLRVSSL